MAQKYLLSEEELNFIYEFTDEFALSKSKRIFSRDFSDGILMSEIVKYFYPSVELHNYLVLNSFSGKTYNWETLNRFFFSSFYLIK
jgi:hypothetical protein